MNVSSGGWIIAAAAAVFLLDVFTPLGIAVPMLYVIPPLLTSLVPGSRITAVIAGCSLLMTGLGVVLSSGEFTVAVAADRAIASALLLIVAVPKGEFDIMLDLNIDIAQAALGADVDVPTVDGPTILKIPSGTQPGRVLNMKGKGVPRLRSNGRGDQLVIINIEVPKRLNDEQRQLFEKLAKSMGSDVRPQERGILDWLKETLGG